MVLIFLVVLFSFFYFWNKEEVSFEKKIAKRSKIEKKVVFITSNQIKKTVEEETKFNSDFDESLKKEEVLEKNRFNSLEFSLTTSFETTEYYDGFLYNYNNGNFEEVLVFGANLLKIPKRYSSKFWFGNLCHAVHIILGKSYLALNRIEKAQEYLIKSVDNRCIEESLNQIYSPQLRSFGPDRSLAYSLYKLGKKDTVIKFFDLSKRFWVEGVESGSIGDAIQNIGVTELNYEQEDNPEFPFSPVAYVIDYKNAPMKKNSK